MFSDDIRGIEINQWAEIRLYKKGNLVTISYLHKNLAYNLFVLYFMLIKKLPMISYLTYYIVH